MRTSAAAALVSRDNIVCKSCGVAVAPRPLVREDLRLGRLVAPFGFVKSGRRYCLLHPAELAQAGRVRTFRRWIEKVARARS